MNQIKVVLPYDEDRVKFFVIQRNVDDPIPAIVSYLIKEDKRFERINGLFIQIRRPVKTIAKDA